jgi:hypothetical protein
MPVGGQRLQVGVEDCRDVVSECQLVTAVLR